MYFLTQHFTRKTKLQQKGQSLNSCLWLMDVDEREVVQRHGGSFLAFSLTLKTSSGGGRENRKLETAIMPLFYYGESLLLYV